MIHLDPFGRWDGGFQSMASPKIHVGMAQNGTKTRPRLICEKNGEHSEEQYDKKIVSYISFDIIWEYEW